MRRLITGLSFVIAIVVIHLFFKFLPKYVHPNILLPALVIMLGLLLYYVAQEIIKEAIKGSISKDLNDIKYFLSKMAEKYNSKKDN